MDGLCEMGRVTMFVLSLELAESEDDEDDDELEVLSSSLCDSSERPASDSEENDIEADGDDCNVLLIESDSATDVDKPGVTQETSFSCCDAVVISCANWETSGQGACSSPFRLLLAGGRPEVTLSSVKLFLFIAVAIEAHFMWLE